MRTLKNRLGSDHDPLLLSSPCAGLHFDHITAVATSSDPPSDRTLLHGSVWRYGRYGLLGLAFHDFQASRNAKRQPLALFGIVNERHDRQIAVGHETAANADAQPTATDRQTAEAVAKSDLAFAADRQRPFSPVKHHRRVASDR